LLWNGASEARVELRRARRKGNQVPAQIETDVNTVCVTETVTLEWVFTATSDSVTEAEKPHRSAHPWTLETDGCGDL